MVYLFLAEGFEEVEALVPLDILHRGGIDVVKVGVTGEYVTSSHGVCVKADITIDNVKNDFEAVILPGGMPGTTNLDNSDAVKSIVQKAYDDKKIVSAICAAPMVLGKMGLLDGKKATCFPKFKEYLKGAEYVRDYAVRDGNIITGCGAGASYHFGFMLLEALAPQKVDDVKRTMQYVL